MTIHIRSNIWCMF